MYSLYLQTIKAMSERLPKTEEEMLKIDGVTQANLKKFGKCMLKITSDYAVKKEGTA